MATWENGKVVCLYLPNNHLADDFSHEQGIRHSSADSRGVLLGVFLLEKDIGHSPELTSALVGALVKKRGPAHSHEIVLVSITDQSEAAGKLYSSVDPLISKGLGGRFSVVEETKEKESLTIVNRSDRLCRFFETSREGSSTTSTLS